VDNASGIGSPATLATLQGRSILVTGATGSFGQAFVRHALSQGARRVCVFSRDELKQSVMRSQLTDDRLRWFLGDVRDPERLTRAMQDVDDVIHAAAMKRIESCEENPDEAIRTNVLGTINVAKAAIDAGVERAVFLSTDKAPNPSTLYGATKLCAERTWLQANVYAAGTATRLAAVRYGNVVNSRGSVIGIWRDQMARQQPLTITSETATRFLMRIGDAVDLVSLALREMVGGELFVARLKAATVLALARAVAEQSGATYAPGHVVTGLKESEREHETLVGPDEARLTHEGDDYYVVEPSCPTWSNRPVQTLPRVSPDFVLRSDSVPRFTDAELSEMVA
jgi:UDP-N-acetylglucosamine 4,6-dehydratase